MWTCTDMISFICLDFYASGLKLLTSFFASHVIETVISGYRCAPQRACLFPANSFNEAFANSESRIRTLVVGGGHCAYTCLYLAIVSMRLRGCRRIFVSSSSWKCSAIVRWRGSGVECVMDDDTMVISGARSTSLIYFMQLCHRGTWHDHRYSTRIYLDDELDETNVGLTLITERCWVAGCT